MGESQQYLSNEARGLIVGRREGRKMDKGRKNNVFLGARKNLFNGVELYGWKEPVA